MAQFEQDDTDGVLAIVVRWIGWDFQSKRKDKPVSSNSVEALDGPGSSDFRFYGLTTDGLAVNVDE